jgi:hypothetical protein
MRQTRLVGIIALAALTAGCAAHRYTRDDMTDRHMFKRQLKTDSAACKRSVRAHEGSDTSGPDTATASQAGSAYDTCMLARGWRHRASGEAGVHPAPAANADSAAIQPVR